MKKYITEPLTDFADHKNIKFFQVALNNVQEQLGKYYPIMIGNETIMTNKKIVSFNPANKREVIGIVSMADQQVAEKAIQVAQNTYDNWKKWKPEHRANILFRAASLLKRRKFEFSAYLVKEAGKSWKEADADTAEAIDFLEYYGCQMLHLKDGSRVLSLAGEKNQYQYIPLGVGVIISPFNFPLAIMVGTTVAAIVAGNTVLLKPANSTPVVAAKFVELMFEAGLPKGVLNFVPGIGAEIGDYLVDHPKTRFISFTGSRDVGCRIYERAAKVNHGQKWLKKVIAEMGGKDAVLVDRNADLDIAATSIVYSAFGYSGQKCSAGSRAVVHKDVYDEVLKKTVELTKKIKLGNPEDPDVFMGPVIDENAFKKIMNYIEIGKSEAQLVYGGIGDDSNGFFIQPTIFSEANENSRIMQEEIFGPVLTFCKAEDFNQMLEIANNTDYGLTGSFISNDRERIERVKEEFHVGNLYINRVCTGAIVGYQPFGGFNMSGTNSKAGGPDYLLHHMQAKTISEIF